jgi:hypothetical protein
MHVRTSARTTEIRAGTTVPKTVGVGGNKKDLMRRPPARMRLSHGRGLEAASNMMGCGGRVASGHNTIAEEDTTERNVRCSMGAGGRGGRRG